MHHLRWPTASAKRRAGAWAGFDSFHGRVQFWRAVSGPDIASHAKFPLADEFSFDRAGPNAILPGTAFGGMEFTMKRKIDSNAKGGATTPSADATATPTDALSRRELLRRAAAVGATTSIAPVIAACSSSDDGGSKPSDGLPEYEYDGPLGPEDLFSHAVASGDPLADAVIIWTRVTQMGSDPVDVWWEIATDPAFEDRVQVGTTTADPDRDFTVKVDVTELDAGTTYYYQFKSLGRTSPAGRTKTAPAGSVARARFGVCSCSSLAHGFFHGYAALGARLDLDAVIVLGDYIYEYADSTYGNLRNYEPVNECVTIDDYRMRHSQYKRDAKLQSAHRQHPFIPVWDDHEVANNSHKTGAENHTEGAEGVYAERRAAGMKAYSEWMPIRDQADGRIFRKFGWGDLADLIMLDTRHWGRDQGSYELIEAPTPPDDMKELLGADQWTWFGDQMSGSTAKWRLVGQQVMVGNLILTPMLWANPDQWHGYPKSRRQLLDLFHDTSAGNIVVLTGDIHSSWAMDLVNDPNDTAEYDPATGSGSAAVEFVTPGITSPGIPASFLSFVEAAVPLNQHIKFFDLENRGYIVLDVDPNRVQAAWYHLADVTDETNPDQSFAAAWSVADGAGHITEDAEPAPDGDAPAPAP